MRQTVLLPETKTKEPNCFFSDGPGRSFLPRYDAVYDRAQKSKQRSLISADNSPTNLLLLLSLPLPIALVASFTARVLRFFLGSRTLIVLSIRSYSCYKPAAKLAVNRAAQLALARSLFHLAAATYSLHCAAKVERSH